MMKKNSFLLAIFILCNTLIFAQDGIGTAYTEPDDDIPTNEKSWNSLTNNNLYVSWASRDAHYKKREVPQIKLKKDTTVYAWRGERVGVEAVMFSKTSKEKLFVRLISEEPALKNALQARYVNYVLTDAFQACGDHPTDWTPYLVPDVIDIELGKELTAKTTRPVWCTLEIPRDINPGKYQARLEVTNTKGEVVEKLSLNIVVNENTLPKVADQQFNLNFWMQPYAISRYYKVENWSKAHFNAMRPYMEMLARAGQKVATVILFYEPWGVQSNDKFEPMIETTKETDGSWSYDYTVFDKWITFLESCGISQQINCFSMVPWDMNFRYIDAKTGKYAYLKTTTSTPEYEDLWTNFLRAFAKHLKEKGWYDKTVIAMDERGLDAMQDAYRIAQKAVPGIKMSLAGTHHTELIDKLYDYCIAYKERFTPFELKRRNAKGYISTAYTSCADAKPNICSNNLPADAAYIPIFCVANGFNGYLHWSWSNWTDDPLRDTRFKLFTPGDTYIVYPGGRSSIRFERIIEGVQQAEKIRILREQYQANGNTEALKKLNDALDTFKSGLVTQSKVSSTKVNYIESLLNNAPVPPLEEVLEYCEVALSKKNIDIALEKRWLKSATTQDAVTNLNYSSNSPSNTGYVIAQETIKVKAGSTFTLNVKPTQNGDDIRWCRVALFADWNGNKIFDETSNELIQKAGKVKQDNPELLDQTFTISVPKNAKSGSSRLRLCYADAWSSEPTPCDELEKGFAFDVPMEIISATGLENINASYHWQGEKLVMEKPYCFFVYNINGALVDHTSPKLSYNTDSFLHGNYILLAVDNQANKRIIKFSK